MNGIVQMTSTEYHADPCDTPSLSSSIAKLLWEATPYHAWLAHPRLNPNYKSVEKQKFDIGTAAHALLLEKDDSKFEIIKADDYKTNAAKAKRDEAYANDKTPLLYHQYLDVYEMVKAAREYVNGSELAGIFEDGKPEVPLFADFDGACFRGLLDWLKTDRKVIVDYKTSASAKPEAFERIIRKMLYAIQGAAYLRLNELTGGPEDAIFVWFVQETESPFLCQWVGLSPSMRAIGRSQLDYAVKSWKRCLSKNEWPAYSKRIAWVEASTWDQSRVEETLYQEEN